MSAWLCCPEHVAEIAKHSGACKGRNPHNGESYDLTVEDLAELLAKENVRSLQYRYPDTWESFFFPEKAEPEFKVQSYLVECRNAAKGLPTLSAKETIGLSHSYEYQACEHEDFYSSNAYFINSEIRESLYRSITFPGRERPLWDYPHQEAS